MCNIVIKRKFTKPGALTPIQHQGTLAKRSEGLYIYIYIYKVGGSTLNHIRPSAKIMKPLISYLVLHKIQLYF